MVDFTDEEEIEEVVIEDEETDEDRGDDFVPEDDAPAEVAAVEPEPDAEEKEPEVEEEEKGVPFSRLNEVSRTKTAATQIADAIVNGEIAPQTIKDMGGTNAVAKAMAAREITLEDLKTGTPMASVPAVPSQEKSLDEMYVEYQELVELGQIKDSAALFQKINRMERALERAEEKNQAEYQTVKDTVAQLLKDYPTLNEVDHPDHEAVMAWANYFQRDKGMNRAEALQKASTKVFTAVKPEPEPETKETDETVQQRVIRERKTAAQKKNAGALKSQPPNMGLGAAPGDGTPLDIASLPDEEYAKVSERDKAIARGDILK